MSQKVKKKKEILDCALCIEEGRSKAAVFHGTRAQLDSHVRIAHRGKPMEGNK